MKDKISIISPEKVEFSVELAGVGSRFFAVFIDAVILWTGFIIMTIAFGFTAELLGPFISTGFLGAAFFVFSFILFWGYFVLFEGLGRGQTLGKRVAGIRVVNDAGRSPGLAAAAIRNLLRIADWLPWFYFSGIVCILVSKKNKRLGDMAAGTLVILKTTDNLRFEIPDVGHKNVSRQIQMAARRMKGPDYELVRKYLVRRGELDARIRDELAEKIATALAGKLSVKMNDGEHERFLEMLADTYQRGPAGQNKTD